MGELIIIGLGGFIIMVILYNVFGLDV